ncbi:hypothetical protein SDC9_83308 [bioreactor metagenome]|uniref:Uncharacterized protein n=1 Tax=bioreactor metagenome TaxID=1076179 RepID=A0A644Z784_9ZZZZ
MAKAGMRRPDPKEPHGTESNHKTHLPKNDVPPVPELKGKAKRGKSEGPHQWLNKESGHAQGQSAGQ